MSKRTLSLVTAALVAALAPTALRAQNSATSPAPGPARSNRVTLGGAFGGLSGAANLNPAGTVDWRLGWIGSIDGAKWVGPHGGIPASGRLGPGHTRRAALSGRGQLN